MNITKLFKQNLDNFWHVKKPTIAFLGDSVTQGCFDVYIESDGSIETFFEQKYAYHRYVADILAMLYPKVPVNIINAGLSGGNAVHGLERLERDVLCYKPDLTVVCFGLNDCGGGMDNIPKYADALRGIFTKLTEAGSEVIFMTPNMMATHISPHLAEGFDKTAEFCIKNQIEGILDSYLEKAKEVAEECGVRICDVYAKWKTLYNNGVNVTELMSNKINHPTYEMNWVFAYSLVEEMMK